MCCVCTCMCVLCVYVHAMCDMCVLHVGDKMTVYTNSSVCPIQFFEVAGKISNQTQDEN